MKMVQRIFQTGIKYAVADGSVESDARADGKEARLLTGLRDADVDGAQLFRIQDRM